MLKEKMKTNFYLLMGIMLLITFVPLGSALYPCDWTTYGGNLVTGTNTQYYWDCKSYFGDNWTSQSYPSGLDTGNPTQPLIAGVGTFEEPRVIISNGNYLQIFDENLDLVTEFFTGGELEGQMGVGNFFDEDKVNGIIGFWRVNASTLTYKVFKFDEENDTLDLTANFTFSYGANAGTNGVRCLSGAETKCYAVLWNGSIGSYQNSIFEFDEEANYTGRWINSTKYSILEPVTWSDWDDDGDTEFLIWSADTAFVYDFENGVTEWTRRLGTPVNNNFWYSGAKFYYPISTQSLSWLEKLFNPDTAKGRIIFVEDCQAGSYTCASGGYTGWNTQRVSAYKPDKSLMWQKDIATSSSNGHLYTNGIAIADYDGDLKDDVWIAVKDIRNDGTDIFKIYKGDSGTDLYSHSIAHPDDKLVGQSRFMPTQTTLFYANIDDTFDFLVSPSNVIFDTTSDSYIEDFDTGAVCVPADLNFDGLQDVVCSKDTITEVFYVNYTNINPSINTVTYDPSTLIEVNSTLYTIISATDPETDQIFYAIRCDTGEDFSNFTSSNAQSCFFDTIGDYEVTVAVKDVFHDGYNGFTQTIYVTQSGGICDNDYVCEAEQGETYLNCPNDCASPEEEEIPDSTTATGGTTLPTQLVNEDNINKGLLPEIYYGTLGFMSSVLTPTIVLVFVIFFALIMITIGGIIKKIAQKVASNGG